MSQYDSEADRYRRLVEELAEMDVPTEQIAEDIGDLRFQAYLDRTSIKVRAWPGWMRNILGAPRSS